MLQVLIAISKKIVVEKKHGVMQKLFIKKRKKERLKNGQVSEILKTIGTQMLA